MVAGRLLTRRKADLPLLSPVGVAVVAEPPVAAGEVVRVVEVVVRL